MGGKMAKSEPSGGLARRLGVRAHFFSIVLLNESRFPLKGDQPW
jgi:hypothetical protein